jgi:uncharacterized protein YdaU (DUF1376 family)
MPLYIADYLRDTRHLTAAEHGAYLLLIMQYWTAGCLPTDDARLARIASMSEAEWQEAKPVIAELFGPGWSHGRIDEELAKSAEKYERRSVAGKRGAASRHGSGSAKTSGVAENGSGNAIPKQQAMPEPNGHENPSNALASSSQPQPLDRIGDAHARGQSYFTEGSKRLANALWKALGFDDPMQIPPEFSGVDWRAVEWEKAGWTVDLIEAEARKLARDSPLKPLTYFEKVFATSFAKRQAPLPVVEIREAEKLTVTTHARTPGSGNVIQAADRLLDKLRSFDAGPSDDHQLRDATGAAASRLLSEG